MRMLHTDRLLKSIEERVLYHAEAFGMTLPEVRFYILDGLEFASLLEKRVYPVSPVNIWEGKRMVTRKFRIESGLESSLYFEVVQTGNPSYAYLNNTNSPTMQASVMAHVMGHCEFSELNVLQDSTQDRTEYVMWLVKKVNQSRQQLGEKNFFSFWNAAESALPLVAPNSQYNLERSVDTDLDISRKRGSDSKNAAREKPKFLPHSNTMDSLLKSTGQAALAEIDFKKKLKQESLSRRGFRLRAPCQDVFGFLRNFAPSTRSERAVLDYLYVTQAPSDFVIRTQIMNEGWAMYWEKKIMTELFKERTVTDIIDYARVFSGVCFARPYYMRNPYHLGFHLWGHIEELYKKGKISLRYLEEKDMDRREAWNEGNGNDPITNMRHLVRTITDYEFLRRFLTTDLVQEFHLNRVPQRDVPKLGISKKDVIDEDATWVWLNPKPILNEMLKFYTHFFQPRIYVIDADFEDGGLLLYHRDDGRRLRSHWIQPTLKNLNSLWKGGVMLISKNTLYCFSGNRYREMRIPDLDFNLIISRISEGKKPLVLS